MDPKDGIYGCICLLFGELVMMFVSSDGRSQSQEDKKIM